MMSDDGRSSSSPRPLADALAAAGSDVFEVTEVLLSERPLSDEDVTEARGAGESTDVSDVVDARDRRHAGRFEVTWSVDCETEDTFLYASITNISEMGIFVHTTKPLPVGTQLTLRFAPHGPDDAFVLKGTVQWVNSIRPLRDNPNPGMGIRFFELTLDDRERIVETIRTIAYLREPDPPN